MTDNHVIILGSGKIGRGFLAELFFRENYHVTFVDQSEQLIEQLNLRGSYRVTLARSKNDIEDVTVDRFNALTTNQKDLLQEEINRARIIAIAVFPKDYEVVANQLRKLLIERRSKSGDSPFNVLLCTNLIHAGPIFQKYIYQGLTEETLRFFESNVGIVESLVIRICPDPVEETTRADPLAVLTNGYPELPVDRNGFKGEIPSLKFFRLVNDMRAEEVRKIYTYNMCHAVLSYLGYLRGHRLLVECLADEEIRNIALGALAEVSDALQKEYAFSPEDMKTWLDGVIDQTNNPVVGDTVIRSAADPVRKLQLNDRLIGPAMLCIKNGIAPKNLTLAIGAAFCFQDKEDEDSNKLQAVIKELGIKAAIIRVCGLNSANDDFIDEIALSYLKTLLKNQGDAIAEKAYKLAFEYEKINHGCGQCALAGILEPINFFNEEVFRSATGLSGGLGQVTDSTCSAFIAGCMALGLFFPRRRKYFNADRSSKYKDFDMIQKLRNKFIEEYGSTTCLEIHRFKYGRTFDLTKKPEAESFEQAGAHGEHGCTEVVANSARWTTELLATEFKTNAQEVN